MEEKINKKEDNKKKDVIYIVIILLLLGLAGYLGYANGSLKKDVEVCSGNVDVLTQEKKELNMILKNTGMIAESDQKELKSNLLNLLNTYDSIVETSNDENMELQDSILAQKQKITELLAEVEKLENQKDKDWGKIYKLKKESATLREIMKGYIHTIDSLNTLNINLQNTIVEKDKTITDLNTNLEDTQSENKQLQSTVQLGSVLQSVNMTAMAIKVKSSGAQKETSRANRADQIKTCFTILENKIAKAENKTLFMRIIAPDGKELYGENPAVFSLGETDGKAAISRKINYQNANVDVCIYYELESEISEGTYIVEIYAEGNRIGKTSFALK